MALTYTEVLELIHAGYTKAEIDAFAAAPATDPAGTDHQDDNQGGNQDDAGGAPEAETEPEPETHIETETEKLLKALGVQIQGLAHAVQAKNVNTIDHPGETETAETILARIINPKFGGDQ